MPALWGRKLTTHRAEPTSREVFALAWPMTLKAIMLHGTVVIDGYLVSGLGERALAAMGLSAAIAGLVLGAILAFAGAMQIRSAQAFGTGDPVFRKSVLLSGLVVSLIIGCFGLAVIAFAGSALIDIMAPDVIVATLAEEYLAIFSLVILAEAVGQCLSSYFNGCGCTRIPLFSFCLSLPINVAVSVVLINGYLGFPHLGVAGAAIGSVIAVSIQVTYLIARLYQRDSYLYGVTGWRQVSFLATLKRHIVFSLPIAATFFSATISAQVCTLIYAKLTLNEFAAMTLIAPWIMVAGTIGMQWAQATGIVVAQLLGQQREEAVLDRFLGSAWRGALLLSGVVSILYVAICLSANAIYTDLSAETCAILLGFLPILALLPFPKGSNAICGNTLRASGDTVYVMNIFLGSQWLFRVPATALAVLYLNFSAFWVLSLLVFEELIKFPVFHRRLLCGKWKKATVAL